MPTGECNDYPYISKREKSKREKHGRSILDKPIAFKKSKRGIE